MAPSPKPRRLIDLAGIRELEQKALMNPRYADADARDSFPDLDAASRAVFGLTADQADDTPRPDGWDRIERKPTRDQVIAFEAAGWDVTDDKRRPLRTLDHFKIQLWLALRGVAGGVPFQADAEDDFGHASLAADAAKFRRDRI